MITGGSPRGRQGPQFLAVGICAGGSLEQGKKGNRGEDDFLKGTAPRAGPSAALPTLLAAHAISLSCMGHAATANPSSGCAEPHTGQVEDGDAGGASRLGGEKGWRGASQRKRRRGRWLGVTMAT